MVKIHKKSSYAVADTFPNKNFRLTLDTIYGIIYNIHSKEVIDKCLNMTS